MSDDLETERTTPPEDHEWKSIWPTLEKAKRSWPITRPFVAVYENWQALVFVVFLTGLLNGPEIIALLQQAWGLVP